MEAEAEVGVGGVGGFFLNGFKIVRATPDAVDEDEDEEALEVVEP